MAIDYKSSGVDVEAGDELVDWLRRTQPRDFPHQEKLVTGIGGFASMFRLPHALLQSMAQPVLVSSTDGVGTKVKLASHFQQFEGVGQDLVAMCVNDLICCGADPLFFLDYYATGHLNLTEAKQFLFGVRQACHRSQCALVGGETAEMPGVYQAGDFDCAGFVVGIVDEAQTLGAHRVKLGDKLLGLASSGFHSNGYSLLRKVFAAELESWREPLMRPTRLYVSVMQKLKKLSGLRAAAHITGGGIENIPRALPGGSQVRLQQWPWPTIFVEVQKRAQLSPAEMLGALNCGVGLVVVVEPSEQRAAEQICRDEGIETWELGVVEPQAAADAEARVLVDFA